MRPTAELLVSPSASIRGAFERLNKTAIGVLLLVDSDGRLLRTVTDGDLRRMLLETGELDRTLEHLPPRRSITVNDRDDGIEALRVMNENKVDQLPAVDSNGKPVGVWIRCDLQSPVYLSAPHMGDQEREFVAMAFESNWIAPLGPNVDAFEKEMAAYAGVTQAAATVSGTAAIHLALRLLDVGPKDVVLCSTLTFVASAFPILYQGARPVFVDSEPSTWNMSPEALERAFADLAREGVRPKAVIVVNLYGQSADYERLLALCRRWGVPLVEDAAESLGATYRDRASGTLGDMGIFSFNGNKIITTSGGGMLVSNNAEQVERARFLSTQARDPRPWYEHSQVGYNYRMSNVLAGIGRGQLKVLGDRVQARRDVFDRYVEGLKDVDGLSWMSEAPFGKSTRWLSVCLLDPGRIRATPADVIARLSTIGIETRHVWKPMHRQPIFQGVPYYPHEPGFSFSDMAFEKGICFPSGSNLSRDQQNMVIDRLRQVLTP